MENRREIFITNMLKSGELYEDKDEFIRDLIDILYDNIQKQAELIILNKQAKLKEDYIKAEFICEPDEIDKENFLFILSGEPFDLDDLTIEEENGGMFGFEEDVDVDADDEDFGIYFL